MWLTDVYSSFVWGTTVYPIQTGQEFSKDRVWLKNVMLLSVKRKNTNTQSLLIWNKTFMSSLWVTANYNYYIFLNWQFFYGAKNKVTFQNEKPLTNAVRVACSKDLNHIALQCAEVNVCRLPGSQLYCGLTTQTSDPLISLFNKELVHRQYNCLMPLSYFSVH